MRKGSGKAPTRVVKALVSGAGLALIYCCRSLRRLAEGTTMAWTTPTLVEICIGLEINGYLPAEF